MRWALMTHLLGVVVWVGGMFFAYMALRPAAAQTLQPPERLSLWRATFQRFFPWVWLAIAFILTSGFYMIADMGGFSAVPVNPVLLMLTLGLIMVFIFGHVYFAAYRKFSRLVNEENWPAAGNALGQIRVLIALNLALGLSIIVLASLG